MKARDYLLNALLAAVLFIALLACMLVKTFLPGAVLPKLDIPNMVLISMAALLLDHFVAPGAKRCYICIPVFAAISFALLPWAAGLAAAGEIWITALIGAVVFTACSWLYTSAVDRMASGKKSHVAAIVTAVVFFLAAQGFAGICL